MPPATAATVIVLALAAVGLTACGSLGSSDPTILNTEKVERTIERAALKERRIRVQVSCPSGVVQKKGIVFTCRAVVAGGGSTRFIVTELDDAGRVRYEGQ